MRSQLDFTARVRDRSREFVKNLKSMSGADYFAKPVDRLVYPDYYSMCPETYDLSYILRRARDSGSWYKYFDEMEHDLRTTFNNALKYFTKPEHSDIRASAMKLLHVCESFFAEVRSDPDKALPRGRPSKEQAAAESSAADQWVQCDRCKKWRKLPHGLSPESLPTTWTCKDNTWRTNRASCDVPPDDEDVDDDEDEMIATVFAPKATPSGERGNRSRGGVSYLRFFDKFPSSSPEYHFWKSLELTWDHQNFPASARKQIVIAGAPVDPLWLYCRVVELGGYDVVNGTRGQWSSLFSELPVAGMAETTGPSRLKKFYEKMMLEFERRTGLGWDHSQGANIPGTPSGIAGAAGTGGVMGPKGVYLLVPEDFKYPNAGSGVPASPAPIGKPPVVGMKPPPPLEDYTPRVKKVSKANEATSGGGADDADEDEDDAFAGVPRFLRLQLLYKLQNCNPLLSTFGLGDISPSFIDSEVPGVSSLDLPSSMASLIPPIQYKLEDLEHTVSAHFSFIGTFSQYNNNNIISGPPSCFRHTSKLVRIKQIPLDSDLPLLSSDCFPSSSLRVDSASSGRAGGSSVSDIKENSDISLRQGSSMSIVCVPQDSEAHCLGKRLDRIVRATHFNEIGVPTAAALGASENGGYFGPSGPWRSKKGHSTVCYECGAILRMIKLRRIDSVKPRRPSLIDLDIENDDNNDDNDIDGDIGGNDDETKSSSKSVVEKAQSYFDSTDDENVPFSVSSAQPNEKENEEESTSSVTPITSNTVETETPIGAIEVPDNQASSAESGHDQIVGTNIDDVANNTSSITPSSDLTSPRLPRPRAWLLCASCSNVSCLSCCLPSLDDIGATSEADRAALLRSAAAASCKRGANSLGGQLAGYSDAGLWLCKMCRPAFRTGWDGCGTCRYCSGSVLLGTSPLGAVGVQLSARSVVTASPVLDVMKIQRDRKFQLPRKDWPAIVICSICHIKCHAGCAKRHGVVELVEENKGDNMMKFACSDCVDKLSYATLPDVKNNCRVLSPPPTVETVFFGNQDSKEVILLGQLL